MFLYTSFFLFFFPIENMKFDLAKFWVKTLLGEHLVTVDCMLISLSPSKTLDKVTKEKKERARIGENRGLLNFCHANFQKERVFPNFSIRSARHLSNCRAQVSVI